MAQDYVVIVTEEHDPHTDHVIHLLRAMGQPFLRLHPGDLPQEASVAFAYDSHGWGGTIHSQGRTIDVDAIRSIWWRRPKTPTLPQHLSEDEHIFAELEWRYTLRGIWESIDCFWMSPPHCIALASAKTSQLARAARLGFDVPRTLITTDPEAAHSFYEQCGGQIVYKVLSDPFLGMSSRMDEINRRLRAEIGGPIAPAELLTRFRPRGVHTTPIGEAQLAMLESIRLTPCLFQEYVPKQVELRVTVVDDLVFAAEIDSQQHEKTRIDWRHYDVAIPYRAAELPDAVAARCVELTSSYGLNFGAIDLILTPDGRYVFLEINPNGQWLWVQDRVPELPIAEAIAARLARGRSSTF